MSNFCTCTLPLFLSVRMSRNWARPPPTPAPGCQNLGYKQPTPIPILFDILAKNCIEKSSKYTECKATKSKCKIKQHVNCFNVFAANCKKVFLVRKCLCVQFIFSF